MGTLTAAGLAVLRLDPLRALVNVDHLHPDSGIALATAADGEKLTAERFGDRVAWVPWRRPGPRLSSSRRTKVRPMVWICRRTRRWRTWWPGVSATPDGWARSTIAGGIKGL